jgi:hypothetical protein
MRTMREKKGEEKCRLDKESRVLLVGERVTSIGYCPREDEEEVVEVAERGRGELLNIRDCVPEVTRGARPSAGASGAGIALGTVDITGGCVARQ